MKRLWPEFPRFVEAFRPHVADPEGVTPMPIAASAICYYPTPCAPWPALRRQADGYVWQGSGRKLFRGSKNCQPPLQPIVAKGEKRPEQS